MSTIKADSSPEGEDRLFSNGRGPALLLLVLVYTFNFVDRQIVGILAVPIKTDLGLSDTQLGLMGGLAFALFYTALGIPIARLADRYSRTWIMTVALAFWSAMTALCGLANSFWQLFAARVGVGIGEAGGVAPAYSLISDLFPRHQRARALAIYSFGIPIGSASGIVLGGVVATLIDWRIAFLFAGLAGIALAPVFRWRVKEPVRGQFDADSQTGVTSAVRDITSAISRKPSFWLISLAASCSSMMGYGLFFWLPSFFVRSFDLSLLHASLYYGAMLLFGGIAGIWLGGWLGDRLGVGDRKRYLTIPAWAFVANVPLYFVGVLSNDPVVSFVLLLVPTALGMMWLGPVISVVQHLVRPDMRATTSAVFLFIINLVGIGVGTYLIGALSDLLRLTYGDESLRYSIVVGTGFYLLAAVFYFLAARRIARDWEG